jgi:hypothetical protein
VLVSVREEDFPRQRDYSFHLTTKYSRLWDCNMPMVALVIYAAGISRPKRYPSADKGSVRFNGNAARIPPPQRDRFRRNRTQAAGGIAALPVFASCHSQMVNNI